MSTLGGSKTPKNTVQTQDPFRFFWLVNVWLIPLGALAVFQSSQEINVQKIVYVIYFCASAFIALHYVNLKSTQRHLPTRNLSTYGVVITSMCFLFLIVGEVTSEALRNILPYILFGLAPAIGVALGLTFRTSYLRTALLVLTSLSAFITFSDWISRRGATEIFAKAGLAGATFPALGFAVALWASFYSKGSARVKFSVVAGFILMAMLSTGSRTNLLFLLAAVPLIVFKSRVADDNSEQTKPTRRLAFRTIVQISLVGLAAFLILQSLNLADFILLRLVSINQTFLVDAFSDQSFVLRQTAYDFGARAFAESPLWGAGLNQNFTGPLGDTQFSALLKFGALGYLLVSAWFAILALNSSKLSAVDLKISRAVQGWILILLAISFSGPVFEDKSTALAVIFVTALSTSATRGNPNLKL
jgi:hypothetical protein